jgi:hypothetical protein
VGHSFISGNPRGDTTVASLRQAAGMALAAGGVLAFVTAKDAAAGETGQAPETHPPVAA